MFNVCLSWSYCSCKSLAKLKCEIDVYVSMKRLLSFLFLWCYSSIFDYLFSPPLTHSVGRISLNSNLALSQISKERGELLWGNYCPKSFIFFILWQSIYHSWHAIHWGGMEEYNSEWLRGMHFCYSQYQTSY